jgi:uncharacterized RDD family membrane protein YckC
MAEEQKFKASPPPSEAWPATGEVTPGTPVQPERCPNCRSPLPPDAMFCGSCGYKIAPSSRVEYAGFWMRFVAAIVDGFILGAVQIALTLAIDDQASVSGLSFLVSMAYTVGFWATEGATPGKMAMGCKIVEAEMLEPISVGRSFGRYFAQILSALTLGIGYLMIAFTPEKRGLHDYVAGTVVIKTR